MVKHCVGDGPEMVRADGASTPHNDKVCALGGIDQYLIRMSDSDGGVDPKLRELLRPALEYSFKRWAFATLQLHSLLGTHRYEMVQWEDRRSCGDNDAEAGPGRLRCTEGEINQLVCLTFRIEAQHHGGGTRGASRSGLLRFPNDDHRPVRVSSQVQPQTPWKEAFRTSEGS